LILRICSSSEAATGGLCSSKGFGFFKIPLIGDFATGMDCASDGYDAPSIIPFAPFLSLGFGKVSEFPEGLGALDGRDLALLALCLFLSVRIGALA
jgi:hypothetical protein